MKYLLIPFFSFFIVTANAQKDAAVTLRSILLEQLLTTHGTKDWFVPAGLAVSGLTAEQANWKDKTDNHSIAQLTTHLIFWNKQLLDKFQEIKPDTFNGNNKETFSEVNEKTWKATVVRLDSVLTALEQVIRTADESKLKKIASTTAHIGTHNAYHTGQILYIRKMKGWWNENDGVK